MHSRGLIRHYTTEKFRWQTMLREISRTRRFFLVITAEAVAMATLAALVNLYVGPINSLLWLFPVAMVLFGAITLILVTAVLRQAEDSEASPWMRWLFGERFAHFLRRASCWNARAVSFYFLIAMPLIFLLIAAISLFDSITDQVNSGG